MTNNKFKCGGVNRIIQMPCGWGTSGSVREVDNKRKIHTKYCSVCKAHSGNEVRVEVPILKSPYIKKS